MELRSGQVRASRGVWDSVSAAALLVWLADALPALAQDNVVGTATLPRDLSPWGMFLNADPVVKAVLIGLAFASLVTWTVGLAKSIEIFFAKRRVRAASKELAGIRSLEKVQQFAEIQGEVAQFLGAAATELKLSLVWSTTTASRNGLRRGSNASKRAAGGASCAAPACSPPSARPRPSSACSARCGAS